MSVLWAIAFGICPQRPTHSLFLGGQQMPIEARMAGMFGGFVIGGAYSIATGRGRASRMPGRRMAAVLLSFIALLGIDGFNALFFDAGLPNLYSPNLPLRLGTGLLTGLAFAGFVIPAFNATVWRTGQDVSPLANARHLLAAIGLEALYFIAALSGAGILLYPVSLIAVLGVPLLMGMLGSVLIAIVSGQANRATRLGELVPLMLGGLAFAAIMLGMMSAARYALFGSGPLELTLR